MGEGRKKMEIFDTLISLNKTKWKKPPQYIFLAFFIGFL